MTTLVLLLIGVVLLDHLVLAKFAPAFGSDDDLPMRRVAAIACATALLLTITVPLTHLVQQTLPLALEQRWIGTLALVGLVVVSTRILVRSLRTRMPSIASPMRFLAPLAAINTLVIGIALLLLRDRRDLLDATLSAFGVSLGFALALVLFTAMIERLEASDVPPALRGAPIAIVNAGLMALAVMGLAGLLPD